ncbi:MAG: ATP-binding protein [Verrucomicrobia bacterium]|nr:ATP-binding protein [Verrucomicrobiota bacterium]
MPFLTRWCRAGCGMLLVLASAGCCAAAASPQRVLILDPFERDVAPFSTVVSILRTTLALELGEPVEFHEVALDLAYSDGADGDAPLLTLLETRLKARPVDLVVPVGGASIQFAARHRARLFPNTPVLAVAGDPRLVPPDFLRTKATMVTQRVNLPGMVEDILRLQPGTTQIAVVFGASPLEKFWVGECRREFQGFKDRVTLTYLDDLPFDEMRKRCAALPPHSFILFGMVIVDAAGVPYGNDEALRQLAAVANAPIFGYFSGQFGMGTIGGRLYQEAEVGARSARVAIRMLRGEVPESIPPQILGDAAPVYDWRELKRWGIDAARLPVGSEIRFRQPGFWERYRWLIAGTVLFCLLQAALIIGLLVNRAKRRQGEAEATLIADISSKFVNLPASEVDREILDAQRRICEFLDLDLSALWQWSMETPRIITITHLYRPLGGPPLPEPMDAHDHFPWCQQRLEAGEMVLVSSLEDLPAEAARDQEVWRHLGIKSIVTFPLSPGGPVIGALSFNTMRHERAWPGTLVQRLQLVSQIFTNALERKHADQALRESKERMSLAAEAAHFGVWEWSLARNEVWGSDRWLRLFGFDAGETVSFEKILERIHPNDREEVAREVRHALVSGSDYAGEFSVVLPDGTQHWIASRGRGYPGADGTPIRMVGAALDITQQRLTEQEAQELRSNLTHLTRVNTLGALSGSLAHELNQPLGIILSNAQAAQELLLQSPPDVAEVQAILVDIVAADRRAGEVIERLRTLLKHGQLSLQPLPLNQVIKEVLHLMRTDLIGRGVTVVCELAPELPPVTGDRVQLQQLVLNLILNAADAMVANEPGTRRLVFRTWLHQNRVQASVRDEGNGLPADAERLFQPFYTTKPQGLGLGLAICSSIVTAHHGRLWAEPHPERGAVFHFELPAAGPPDQP